MRLGFRRALLTEKEGNVLFLLGEGVFKNGKIRVQHHADVC